MTKDLLPALTAAAGALRLGAHRIVASNGPAAQGLAQAADAADLALSEAMHQRKAINYIGGGGGSEGRHSGGAIDPATLPGGSKSGHPSGPLYWTISAPGITTAVVSKGAAAAWNSIQPQIEWSHVSGSTKDSYTKAIRAALEAVAPDFAKVVPIATRATEDAKPQFRGLGTERRPAPMVLYCPSCHVQHIDAPDAAAGWDNRPHRSHLCANCGHIWRPADFFTVGVGGIKTTGEHDSEPAVPGWASNEIERLTTYIRHRWPGVAARGTGGMVDKAISIMDGVILGVPTTPAARARARATTLDDLIDHMAMAGFNVARSAAAPIKNLSEIPMESQVYWRKIASAIGAVAVLPTPAALPVENAIGVLDTIFNAGERRGHKTLDALIAQIRSESGYGGRWPITGGGAAAAPGAQADRDVMLLQDGWSMAPRWTTNAMIDAGREALRSQVPDWTSTVRDGDWYNAMAARVWRVMYDAKPPYPINRALERVVDVFRKTDEDMAGAMRAALKSIGVE